ncbi:hypothetical protein M3Y94_01256800 [Aphelenchoides besseyi]|nr:hypothetical protein M3Y94_01256800 [Aphelenchoides besseyi]
MGCTPSRPRRSLNSSLSRPSYNRRCALPPPANHSSKRFLKLPKGNGPKFVHVKMQVEDRVICDMVVKKQEFERNLGDNLHLPLTLNWSNVKLIVEATGGDLKSSSTEPEIEKKRRRRCCCSWIIGDHWQLESLTRNYHDDSSVRQWLGI